jgi:hypothetical protein
MLLIVKENILYPTSSVKAGQINVTNEGRNIVHFSTTIKMANQKELIQELL